MKKVLAFVFSLLVLTACTDTMNTPTKKVEEYLNKYQTLNTEVLTQLDDVVNKDTTLNNENKELYKKALKRQYQDLSYKVNEETIDGDNATVNVQIEVYDYGKSTNESNDYLLKHNDEFLNDKKEVDNDKYAKYRIEKLEKVKDKVNYTITFTLTKVNNKWKLDDISNDDILRLHGLYEG